jgi:flagellar basal body rod protein FlgG
MRVSQQWLDTIANNLANASTVGYKRDGVAFGEASLQPLPGIRRLDGGPASWGRGAKSVLQYVDQTVGPMSPTGNPLDFGIPEPGVYFAVQSKDGVRYTRAGSFRADSDGTLVDGAGRAVLDQSLQPIRLSPGLVEAAPDGTLRQGGTAVGRIGLFAGQAKKAGGGLFTGELRPHEGSLVTGALEQSNVNAIEEMVAMIRLNRVFEMAQKSIQGQDEGTQRLIQSLQSR